MEPPESKTSSNTKNEKEIPSRLFLLLANTGMERFASTIESILENYDNALATPTPTIKYLLYEEFDDMPTMINKIARIIDQEKCKPGAITRKIQHLSKTKLNITDDMSVLPSKWSKYKNPLTIPLLRNMSVKYELKSFEQCIMFVFGPTTKKSIESVAFPNDFDGIARSYNRMFELVKFFFVCFD